MGSAQKRAVKGVIRIIFAKNPPDAFTTCNSFPVLIPSMDCPFPGWLVEVVKMLADYLSFQIDPIIIQSEIGNVNWGHNDSGNWTGILGILQQGMADTVCTLYPFTEQKARFFNFSHPVTSVRDLYIAKPKRKSISLVLWNAFLPYEPKLWMLLFLSLVIQCGLASLVCNIEYRLNLRSTYSPLEKLWHYLRLQIHQATEIHTPFHLQSGNLAFLFYALIQATLFTQLYTAVLLSALIRGQNPNPWDSYKEMVHLVRDGTYSLVMDKHHLHKDNSFYETLSYYTNLSQLRNLADAIKNNPIIVVENVSQSLDYVEKGGFILPTKQFSLAYQMSKERCDFFYFEDDNNQIPTFFLFSRHSKLLREWNRAIQNNQAFIRRTYEKYFFNSFNTGNVPRCKRTTADDKLEWYGGRSNAARDASLSLDIVSTFGIFLIVLIGFTIALLAFVCELLVDAKARRFHRKWHIRHALVFTASNPTHLMAIARQMHHKRKRMTHLDSQTSTETPPAFFREGNYWWQRKTRQQNSNGRSNAIIAALTLAAISSVKNDEKEGEEAGRAGEGMRKRKQNNVGGREWMLGRKDGRGDEDGWMRTPQFPPIAPKQNSVLINSQQNRPPIMFCSRLAPMLFPIAFLCLSSPGGCAHLSAAFGNESEKNGTRSAMAHNKLNFGSGLYGGEGTGEAAGEKLWKLSNDFEFEEKQKAKEMAAEAVKETTKSARQQAESTERMPNGEKTAEELKKKTNERVEMKQNETGIGEDKFKKLSINGTMGTTSPSSFLAVETVTYGVETAATNSTSLSGGGGARELDPMVDDVFALLNTGSDDNTTTSNGVEVEEGEEGEEAEQILQCADQLSTFVPLLLMPPHYHDWNFSCHFLGNQSGMNSDQSKKNPNQNDDIFWKMSKPCRSSRSFRHSIASQPDCHLLIGFVDHLHKFPTNTLITKLRGTTMDGQGAVVRLVCANEMEQFIGREADDNERKKTNGDEETFLKTVVVAEKTWLPGCIAVFFDSRTLDLQLDNMAKLLWKGGEPKFGTTDGNNKWAASKFFCGEKERDLFYRELYKMKARNEKVFNGILIIGAGESEKRNVLLKKLDEELYCAEKTEERGFFQRLWNGLFG
uniref:Uncharacterized protein n=1 Tax=Globodera rostochiensis TaxID=31243 RepID=A0A914H292_GLORO